MPTLWLKDFQLAPLFERTEAKIPRQKGKWIGFSLQSIGFLFKID